MNLINFTHNSIISRPVLLRDDVDDDDNVAAERKCASDNTHPQWISIAALFFGVRLRQSQQSTIDASGSVLKQKEKKSVKDERICSV